LLNAFLSRITELQFANIQFKKSKVKVMVNIAQAPAYVYMCTRRKLLRQETCTKTKQKSGSSGIFFADEDSLTYVRGCKLSRL